MGIIKPDSITQEAKQVASFTYLQEYRLKSNIKNLLNMQLITG